MCGILFVAEALGSSTCPCSAEACAEAPSANAAPAPCAATPPAAFVPGLTARGPDHLGACSITIDSGSNSNGTSSSGGARLLLAASLLQLRGAARVEPPLTSSDGSVLCFNGELFGGLPVPPQSNDGEALLAALEAAAAEDIPRLLSALRGPWTVVYWRATDQQLWFGRDLIGRRSLLMHLPTASEPRFVLSSVAPLPDGTAAAEAGAFEWRELEPGIHSIGGAQLAEALNHSPQSSETAAAAAAAANSSEPTSSGSSGGRVWPSVQRHAWACEEVRRLVAYERPPALLQPPATAAAEVNGSGRGKEEVVDPALRAAAQQLLPVLIEAVRVRCQTRKAPGIVDGATNGINGTANGSTNGVSGSSSSSSSSANGVNGGSSRNSPAAADTQPLPPLLPPAPVLILFSGGNDSTLLAALTDKCLPPGVPIDLANVCFDSGQSHDRRAARDSLIELSEHAADRPWRLIEVDSSLEEVDAARARLLALLAPAGTVMDLNIGAAFWLAARGEGRVVTPEIARAEAAAEAAAGEATAVAVAAVAVGRRRQRRNSKWKPRPTEGQQQQEEEGGLLLEEQQQGETQQVEQQQQQQEKQEGQQQPHAAVQQAPQQRYRSQARVVLIGNGADESAAGYGRCLTAYRNGGWPGVAAEIATDMQRIWLRNLGRDDRLVSDHGREARHPYLDESVMGAVLDLPVCLLLDPSPTVQPGYADKRVLREALRLLGPHRAAARDKKAIQFGCKIVQKSNVRDFGSGRKAAAAGAGYVALRALPWASGAAACGGAMAGAVPSVQAAPAPAAT